jgi:endothelin-converting enzyme/putative endopeptidase
MKRRAALVLVMLPMVMVKSDGQSAVDLAAMDRTADACVDFYQYACGGWMAAHPIPPNRPGNGRFREVGDHNDKLLLDILQKAASGGNDRSELDRKIGDAFAACLDTATIERKGIRPLRPELDRINAMTRGDLAVEVARLHRRGVFVLFQSGARPGAQDASRNVAFVRQRGLSLPDREYYLQTDAKSVEVRKRFTEHVRTMFRLAGDSTDTSASKAASVIEIETTLAAASMDRTSLRNPLNTQHVLQRNDLNALWPDFAWDRYFTLIGSPRFETLNVEQPDFLKQIGIELRKKPIDALRAYFAFQLLHQYAPELSKPFEEEDFAFWKRYLTGASEPPPRPELCEQAVDRQLPDLLGQKFVEVAFGAEAKSRMTQLLGELRKAMAENIGALSWMTADTKAAALDKLSAMNLANVGRPPAWRDYSMVSIASDDFLGNEMRATEAVMAKRAADVGTSFDKNVWGVNVHSANAFYFAPTNSVALLAGILRPPFFDPDRDMAVNYGAIGALLAHELTHGFDDQGRRYDGQGNLRDWWTPTDKEQFETRAACLVDQYSGFTAIDDIKVNGRLTLAENIADNGSVHVALMALQRALGENRAVIDGFTPEQRFFLGYAQTHCENRSPQAARTWAMTDNHAPDRYRVNGTLQNSPEFHKAFSCKAGQPMVSPRPCRVW